MGGSPSARGALLLPLLLAIGVLPAHGQGAPVPHATLFRPLRADPKQPQTNAALLWMTSAERTTTVASVSLGDAVPLARGTRLELSLAAGIYSQFDVGTSSNDLLITDFVIGLPLAWRSGSTSLRARVYHQSSHLGDEYLPRLGREPREPQLRITRAAGGARHGPGAGLCGGRVSPASGAIGLGVTFNR